MKRPPNIAVTGIVAVIAFSAILLVRYLTQPAPQSPWRTDEAAAFTEARRDGKHVMIDFVEEWSVPSVEMSAALDKLRGAELDDYFVPLRLDISKADARTEELRARYRLQTTPVVLFVGVDGTVRNRVDFLPTERELRDAAHAAR